MNPSPMPSSNKNHLRRKKNKSISKKFDAATNNNIENHSTKIKPNFNSQNFLQLVSSYQYIRKKITPGSPSLLIKAIYENDLTTVDALLQQDPTSINQTETALPKTLFIDAPIHAAVRSGNLDMVRLLILHKANLNQLGANFERPLNIAIRESFFRIFQTLLANDADFIAPNQDGSSILNEIYNNPNREFQEEIMKSMLKIHSKKLEESATKNQQIEKLKLEQKILDKIFKYETKIKHNLAQDSNCIQSIEQAITNRSLSKATKILNRFRGPLKKTYATKLIVHFEHEITDDTKKQFEDFVYFFHIKDLCKSKCRKLVDLKKLSQLDAKLIALELDIITTFPDLTKWVQSIFADKLSGYQNCFIRAIASTLYYRTQGNPKYRNIVKIVKPFVSDNHDSDDTEELSNSEDELPQTQRTIHPEPKLANNSDDEENFSENNNNQPTYLNLHKLDIFITRQLSQYGKAKPQEASYEQDKNPILRK